MADRQNGQIPDNDRQILRQLAARQMEYAVLPVMQERIAEWYRHNDLQKGRPMVHLELGTFESEIIPQRLACTSAAAREVEASLYRNFLNYELFDDDRIVPPFFPIGWQSWFRLFGRDIGTTRVIDSHGRDLGHQFQYIIKDLAADLPQLGKTDFGVDRPATLARKAWLEELFGDILPVRIVQGGLYAVPTQQIVHMMGMENMFISLYDYPDEMHALMRRITDDYLAWHQYLAKGGYLLPTNSYSWVGQGTLGFTRQLPGPDHLDFVRQDGPAPVSVGESWGFLDSQETVGLAPEMFAEFFFPYYKEIADTYGLLSYGCCEPVHQIWDSCLSRLGNLRKLSISPWCDEFKMGEALRGRPTIYHRKPSPNFIGIGYDLDVPAFTSHIRQTMQAARGCQLEITMRDIYTLEGNLAKARDAIRIIRQLSETDWQA